MLSQQNTSLNLSQKSQTKQGDSLTLNFNKTSDSIGSDVVNKSNNDGEYDPRPDFKPIIPLPDEIEVRTGEEDEEVLFCSKAKLFRHVEKEWKERGVGDIKILKSKSDGNIRILMRRYQTHKICANHKITGEMKLSQLKNEEKSYIWAANDFADEEIRLEKFCVRFKEVETAKEFYSAFMKAKDETKKQEDKQPNDDIRLKPLSRCSVKDFSNNKNITPVLKKEIANTSTPSMAPRSLFEKVSVASSDKSTSSTLASNKSSPFANFTFNPNSTQVDASKPFANIFGSLKTPSVLPSPIANTTPTYKTDDHRNKSISDAEDDYEPTVQFKPVIPLPDLVEVQTGEENEVILFEHRAKLLRYDKIANEWKERGLGNIKILQDKNDVNKVRLVMRREIIHKLCCNQRLYKDTVFKNPKNTQNALMWVGKDFSENELQTETLSLRFKTADICKNFHEAILKAQADMTDDDDNKEKNALVSKNDKSEEKKGFGDKFKPKVGSWSCKACYISNNADALYCIACESPKDDNVPKKEPKSILTIGDKPQSTFTFGFPSTDTVSSTVPAAAATQGFGDKFKPKVGSWDCEGCYVTNTPDALICVACGASKDGTVSTGTSVSTFSTVPSTAFSFGFQNAANPITTTSATVPTTSSFSFGNVTSASKTSLTNFNFSFGSTSTTATSKPDSQPNNVFSPATFSFSTPTVFDASSGNDDKTSTVTKPDFSFDLRSKSDDNKISNGETFPLDKKEFQFTLKPKSPGKVKSPLKSNTSGIDEEDDYEECDEEENNTYFTPVIPLPDKVDVKTGEEDEEVLYCQRSKLYRFSESEWKERGLGDVKILRHKENKKLRVLMRRERVLKICLNHPLTSGVVYKRKDDKSWQFAVRDFSEGIIEDMQFCIRFKTKEICDEFMDNIRKSLSGEAVPICTDEKNNEITIHPVANGKEIISEANKELADKLLLPYEFFNYDVSDNKCDGCRGCEPDSFVFPDYENTDIVKDENPLPLTLSNLSLGKPILKQSLFSFKTTCTDDKAKNNSSEESKILENSASESTNESCKFSFSEALKSCDTESNLQIPFVQGGFLFGNTETQPFYGSSTGSSIFGGSLYNSSSVKTVEPNETSKSLFSGVLSAKPKEGGNIFGTSEFTFGSNGSKTPFSLFSSTTSATDGTLFGGKNKTVENDGSSNSIFKDFGISFNNPAAAQISNESQPLKDANANSENENPILKGDGGLDFASLAKSGGSTSTFKTAENTSGFVGLTNSDAFSSFLKSNDNTKENSLNKSQDANANEEENYDPHYEPVIELPKEIAVSTGEEEENKLFGERATLFRYDATNKEWKERGVGELKILHHPVHGTYRLLLRREQIHKLVLNHAIAADLTFSHMGNNPKAYCWAAINYAEDPSQLEKLAARFKNLDLANKFGNEIQKCIEQLKNRADLEPEED